MSFPSRTILRCSSLILPILLLSAWARSHSTADAVSYGWNAYDSDTTLIRRFVKVASVRGQVLVGNGYFSSLFFDSASPDEGLHFTSHPDPPPAPSQGVAWSFLGFQFTRLDWPGQLGTSALHIPYWFLTLLVSIAPLRTLSRPTRRKKSSTLCPRCGYDLRATPGRCPECGALSSPCPGPAASPAATAGD